MSLAFTGIAPDGSLVFENTLGLESENHKCVCLPPELVYHLIEDHLECAPHCQRLPREGLDYILNQPIGTRNQVLLELRDSLHSRRTDPTVWTNIIGLTALQNKSHLWSKCFDNVKAIDEALPFSELKRALASLYTESEEQEKKEQLARLERRTTKALRSIFDRRVSGFSFETGPNVVTEESIESLLSGGPCDEKTLTLILYAEQYKKRSDQIFIHADSPIDDIKPEFQDTWKLSCAHAAMAALLKSFSLYGEALSPENNASQNTTTWHRPDTWEERLSALGSQLLENLERWDHALAPHTTIEDQVSRFRSLHIAASFFPNKLQKKAKALETKTSPETLLEIACASVKMDHPDLSDILHHSAYLLGNDPTCSLLPLQLVDAYLALADICLAQPQNTPTEARRAQHVLQAINYFRQVRQWPDKETLVTDKDALDSGQRILSAVESLPHNMQPYLKNRLEPHLPPALVLEARRHTEQTIENMLAAASHLVRNPDGLAVLPDGRAVQLPEQIRPAIKQFGILLNNSKPPDDLH